VNLPWLDWQAVYAHVAWGVVLAACGVGALSWRKPFPQRFAVGWVVFSLVACALPGRASPACWLTLAFHLPSLLLVACCGMTMSANARCVACYRVLPTGLALGLVIVGTVLYVDTVGWFGMGLYVRGFGPEAAFAGLLVGAAAVLSIAADQSRPAGFAVLLALMVFALCRLPTGNVWDAVLDPLLWLWAIFSLVARIRARRPAAAPAQPA